MKLLEAQMSTQCRERENVPPEKTGGRRGRAERKRPVVIDARRDVAEVGKADMEALQERLSRLAASAAADAAEMPGTATILGLGSGAQAGKGASISLPEVVERGLPFNSVDRLARELRLPASRLAEKYLGISRPTLTRRRKSGALTTAESDVVVRYARLLEQAITLMGGDGEAALQWLSTPLQILYHQTPMSRARTEAGAREVDTLIGRLEHGICS
jgi:putative toxin-antitoxin system antitoxin component (TIGR02293 family)